jgi:N-acyl-D-amino-acid deacylase
VLDLLITNGWVVDGTGNPGFSASVGVERESVTIHRGAEAPEARRTIDAAGRVVCPGFIDLHSHSALTIFAAPNHDAKVRQGVTTELVGVDGISHAPFKSTEELRRYIWLDSGLNGYPPEPADWLTVGDLLYRYDGKVAINVAYILGNSPVRIWSVGWTDVHASAAQQANMEAVVAEAMASGAWGLSTGLDYPPGSYATTDELAGLARAAAKAGGFYHTHVRNALRRDGPLRPWQEALDIGRMSDSPVHLTHFYQAESSTIGHRTYLALVEDARDQGMDVTFDIFSYAFSSTTPTIVLPSWTKDGGPERLIAALRNTQDRARIKRELLEKPDPWGWQTGWYTNFTRPEHADYDGLNIADIARIRRQDPIDAFIDLILEENLGVSWVGTTPSDRSLADFIAHPFGMIASDSVLIGKNPNPRTYGCFPHVLSEYVRKERRLGLNEAIRKMTSFPAQRLGVPDRGILRDGMKADIVIFDPDTVEALSQPGNLRAFPRGIDYVIVNGAVVIDKGSNTGALPGRALRRGGGRS